MARGPGGTIHGQELDTAPTSLGEDELRLASGLEKIIDRAMDSHRWGDPFVYGIHQELTPGIAELIARRYRAAGWSEAAVREGETGAYVLVLHP